MEDIESIEGALSSLPFFSGLSLEIKKITSGQSHLCFDVFDGKSRHIAKYIGDRDASQEVGALQSTSRSGLAPNVHYVDSQWIISEFITSPPLTTVLHKKEHGKSYAISSLIQAMVCCHKHHASIQPINFTLFLEQRLTNGFFPDHIIKVITSIFETLLTSSEPSQYVLCHGDINFSNVLINTATRDYSLIDYECSGYAEREFDIAMMMAINQIPFKELSDVVTQYQKYFQDTSLEVNPGKVTRYFIVSLYINSLWYFDKFKETDENTYLLAAKVQRNLLSLQIEDIKKGSY